MSEDNQNNDKDKEIEQLKKEKAAIEMKLRRSDEDLYSEDYLNYLKEQNKKQPSQIMSGGRLSDYSDEELQNLPISKLVVGIANEVRSQLQVDEDSKTTKEERVKRKKKVADTKKEIQKFAKEHPDFWNYVAKIDELADENPNLNTEQLYVLAGGKLEEKKPPEKDKEKDKDKGKGKEPPDTRPGAEAGMKKDNSNLSRREIIQQEWQKLK